MLLLRSRKMKRYIATYILYTPTIYTLYYLSCIMLKMAWLPIQVSEKNAQIKQLYATIKSVAEQAQDTTRKVRTEAEKQQNQAETTHSNVKSKSEEEIQTLKKQLQDTVAENREKEQETRKVYRFDYQLIAHILLLMIRKPSREKLRLRIGLRNMMRKWEKSR